MRSLSIESILEQELVQVEKSRNLRIENDHERRPAKQSLIGLSFSGGGIRSATFNLGVLQALANARLLRAVDYISTVSGGGYIGSWLMAWMHHQKIGIKTVEEFLSSHADSPAGVAEPSEVRFLRNYSNYLTPRKGLLGADFWAFVASYLRNTLLNQMILILLLLSLLMVPRSVVTGLHFLELAENSLQQGYIGPLKDYMYAQYLALAVGLLLGFVALVFMGLNLVALDPGENKRYSWFTSQAWVQVLIIVPLFLSAALFTYGFGHFLTDYSILGHPYSRLPLLGVCLYAGPWALALTVRALVWSKHGKAGATGPSALTILITAAITGAMISFPFRPYSHILLDT